VICEGRGAQILNAAAGPALQAPLLHLVEPTCSAGAAWRGRCVLHTRGAC
jgi:hypothetical protein